MGDGSPGSREAEGEGGEGFYIAQSGRSLDLLVIGGGAELEETRWEGEIRLRVIHAQNLF